MARQNWRKPKMGPQGLSQPKRDRIKEGQVNSWIKDAKANRSLHDLPPTLMDASPLGMLTREVGPQEAAYTSKESPLDGFMDHAASDEHDADSLREEVLEGLKIVEIVAAKSLQGAPPTDKIDKDAEKVDQPVYYHHFAQNLWMSMKSKSYEPKFSRFLQNTKKDRVQFSQAMRNVRSGFLGVKDKEGNTIEEGDITKAQTAIQNANTKEEIMHTLNMFISVTRNRYFSNITDEIGEFLGEWKEKTDPYALSRAGAPEPDPMELYNEFFNLGLNKDSVLSNSGIMDLKGTLIKNSKVRRSATSAERKSVKALGDKPDPISIVLLGDLKDLKKTRADLVRYIGAYEGPYEEVRVEVVSIMKAILKAAKRLLVSDELVQTGVFQDHVERILTIMDDPEAEEEREGLMKTLGLDPSAENMFKLIEVKKLMDSLEGRQEKLENLGIKLSKSMGMSKPEIKAYLKEIEIARTSGEEIEFDPLLNAKKQLTSIEAQINELEKRTKGYQPEADRDRKLNILNGWKERLDEMKGIAIEIEDIGKGELEDEEDSLLNRLYERPGSHERAIRHNSVIELGRFLSYMGLTTDLFEKYILNMEKSNSLEPEKLKEAMASVYREKLVIVDKYLINTKFKEYAKQIDAKENQINAEYEHEKESLKRTKRGMGSEIDRQLGIVSGPDEGPSDFDDDDDEVVTTEPTEPKTAEPTDDLDDDLEEFSDEDIEDMIDIEGPETFVDIEAAKEEEKEGKEPLAEEDTIFGEMKRLFYEEINPPGGKKGKTAYEIIQRLWYWYIMNLVGRAEESKQVRDEERRRQVYPGYGEEREKEEDALYELENTIGNFLVDGNLVDHNKFNTSRKRHRHVRDQYRSTQEEGGKMFRPRRGTPKPKGGRRPPRNEEIERIASSISDYIN